MEQQRRIEYLPLSKVQGATRNPKQHAEKDIEASVGRFGFVETPVLDERTGRLVAGHGRIKVLNALKAAGRAAPKGIRVDGGEWLVPVERGWSSTDDHEAEAYLVASNRLTEAGGWDDAGLGALLKDLRDSSADALAGVGFSGKDVDKLLASFQEPAPGQTDPDDTPDVARPENLYVEKGQVWILGQHRLLCGDATRRDDLDRLMLEDRADCLYTDPPYGVAYKSRGKKGLRPIENDDLDLDGLDRFLRDAFSEAISVLREGACAYVFHADQKPGIRPVFEKAFLDVGFRMAATIVWVKQAASMGWQDFRSQYEPILYGWKPGEHRRVSDRTETNVWQISRDAQGKYRHPTQKPVELAVRALKNSTVDGEVVLDVFSGAGAVLIAAEQLGRRARCIELDPAYCQVIIERWQAFTGKKATLEVDPVDVAPRRRPAKATDEQVETAEAILGTEV